MLALAGDPVVAAKTAAVREHMAGEGGTKRAVGLIEAELPA
ncbi:hypothetical protein OH809_09450 [Streptomyces sp. NBC_00873]|nr:hypothetical protein OH809_09450 [Streptomyces sp. NBC_00873]WTA47098.1 hypothetical protein OH821_34370 [Streptomyces sp. NBC_00842]